MYAAGDLLTIGGRILCPILVPVVRESSNVDVSGESATVAAAHGKARASILRPGDRSFPIVTPVSGLFRPMAGVPRRDGGPGHRRA